MTPSNPDSQHLEKPLPCPFCGAMPSPFQAPGGKLSVVCRNQACGVQPSTRFPGGSITAPEAIAAWNRRSNAETAQPKATPDGLREWGDALKAGDAVVTLKNDKGAKAYTDLLQAALQSPAATPSTTEGPHHVYCLRGKLTTTVHDACTCKVLEGPPATPARDGWLMDLPRYTPSINALNGEPCLCRVPTGEAVLLADALAALRAKPKGAE